MIRRSRKGSILSKNPDEERSRKELAQEKRERLAAEGRSAMAEVAARNAEAHCVSDRWHGICSDYFAGIKTRFDFIVANPPYIRSDVIAKLPREVREHDPLIALDGGEDSRDALGHA